MAEYVTLMGAEQVERAARNMSGAADDMLRAANHIDNSLELFMRKFEEQVSRFEAAVDRLKDAT